MVAGEGESFFAAVFVVADLAGEASHALQSGLLADVEPRVGLAALGVLHIVLMSQAGTEMSAVSQRALSELLYTTRTSSNLSRLHPQCRNIMMASSGWPEAEGAHHQFRVTSGAECEQQTNLDAENAGCALCDIALPLLKVLDGQDLEVGFERLALLCLGVRDFERVVVQAGVEIVV